MKEKVQSFGRFLSGMVMPNIGAFIAWGLITALFIPTGWLPNETLARLVGPMISTMLPLLIGYTGGEAVHGKRGGVIGAIATMGVIVGTDVPMFMGAMLVGPLAALVIKKFDQATQNHIKPGFEMLVNNFSLGIFGTILALISMVLITPLVSGLNMAMEAGVGFLVAHGLLPLTSLFIEPAKVLFLNNAINHGILSPMGISQVEQMGKSIFFLLEANPGPGLGILLAYCLAGKGNARNSAPGAIIIHFLGGIHEIYFPYILMNPLLILAAIAGGASGVFTFSLMGVGLTAPASPGSIFAITLMAERHSYVGLFLGILVSAAVAFLVGIPILKFMGRDASLEEAMERKDAMKREAKGIQTASAAAASQVKKIAFACDAGMGSSAMGASVLRKKLEAAGVAGVEVIHTSVSSVPEDVQIVVTHEELRERAAKNAPRAELVLITNFLAAPAYDELVERLRKR